MHHTVGRHLVRHADLATIGGNCSWRDGLKRKLIEHVNTPNFPLYQSSLINLQLIGFRRWLFGILQNHYPICIFNLFYKPKWLYLTLTYLGRYRLILMKASLFMDINFSSSLNVFDDVVLLTTWANKTSVSNFLSDFNFCKTSWGRAEKAAFVGANTVKGPVYVKENSAERLNIIQPNVVQEIIHHLINHVYKQLLSQNGLGEM